MPVSDSHAAGEPILAADINALAALANTNETGLATELTDRAAAIAAEAAARSTGDADAVATAAADATTKAAAAQAAAVQRANHTGTQLAATISDFNTAAVAAGSGTYQPLDSDLTAIAALSTTAFGRGLLALADAAAGRTALGLGTAATAASGDFQPVDSDLTAIAALATTAFGRSLLTQADAAATRTTLGLGSLAVKNAIAVATDITATGTPSSSTFLRGDGAWAAPASAGGVTPGSIVAQVSGGYGAGLPGTHPFTRTTVAPTAGRIAWSHFTTQQAITVTEAHVRVTTAVAASTILIGIYAVNANGQPTGRQWVLPAAYDSSTTGKKSTTGLSVSLPAGNYATALLPVGGAPTLLVMSYAQFGALSDGNNGALNGVNWASNGTAYSALSDPAPSDLVGLDVGGGYPYAPVFLRWNT